MLNLNIVFECTAIRADLKWQQNDFVRVSLLADVNSPNLRSTVAHYLFGMLYSQLCNIFMCKYALSYVCVPLVPGPVTVTLGM